MNSKLISSQVDPQHDGDVLVLAPKDWTDAEEALSKLAHAALDRRRPKAGSDFSAGPRVTEPSPGPKLRPTDVSNDPLAIDPPAPRRRGSRGLTRFLVAACAGVAVTLAWQSYGGTARQMIADFAPPLGWLLSAPSTNPPSGGEIAVEQASAPAVPASVPPAASVQGQAAATTAPETAASTGATASSAELQQQLETMVHDLAAVRQSVEQLAAGQEQMARDIAKLQAADQDIRRRISALPPAAPTARRPVPLPQAAPQSSPPSLPSPQPAVQSAMPPPPSQAAPQTSAAAPPAPLEPPRPPMPVR